MPMVSHVVKIAAAGLSMDSLLSAPSTLSLQDIVILNHPLILLSMYFTAAVELSSL